METICPECFAKGKRVVMKHECLQKPELNGDRFPVEMNCVPAIHYLLNKYTCPECGCVERD
jgi:hypothetical protein